MLRILLGLALVVFLPTHSIAVAQAGNAVTPVAAFAKLPFLEKPSISPDGNAVAAIFSVEGQQKFSIVDLSGASPPVVVSVGENSDINWWHWAGDDWLVVGVGKKQPILGNPIYVSRALRVSRDGSHVSQLLPRLDGQNVGRFVWAASDGSARVMLSVQDTIYASDAFWPRVVEIDLATGKSDFVVRSKPGVFGWTADGNGIIRLGYGYNIYSEEESYLYRKDAKESWKTVVRAKVVDEGLISPEMLLAEPGKALVLDDGSGFNRVRKFDLETQKLGEEVFAIEGRDVETIIENDKGDTPLGYVYTGDRRQVHWVDPEMARIQQDLEKSVTGRQIDIVSMDRIRNRMLIFLNGPDRMGAYYIYDKNLGIMKLFGYENDILQSRPMAAVKTIKYQARDGLEITAILTLPKGREAENLPLIVMPHGGPAARDFERWDYWAQFIADRGYAVIQPNYRGSIGYGTKFAGAGDGEWGAKMQDDLNDAVSHLAGSGIADPKRVCIMGGSYGGYAAMHAAERDSSLFRCAISFAGVSDLPAMRRYDRKFLTGNLRTKWLDSYVADIEKVSPINHVSKVDIPILVMHGKEDLRVPVDQSRKFARALTDERKSVRYVELPYGDHYLSREDDRMTFLKEVEAFLTEYNPAN